MCSRPTRHDRPTGRLPGLTNLQHLKLHGTRVTGDGLVHLRSMTQLEWLSLGGNQVSDAGLAELKQALPNCQVEN